jgi:hypothetical protein
MGGVRKPVWFEVERLSLKILRDQTPDPLTKLASHPSPTDDRLLFEL